MDMNPVPAPEPAALGPFARIMGVFVSPKSTFEDIVRKPTWVVPVVILVILSTAVCITINQRIDWRDFIGRQIEKSPRASQLSGQQKEQQIRMGAKFAPIATYVIGIPGPVMAVSVVALVMMGAFKLLAGAKLDYVTSLALVAHAFFITILKRVLFLILLFLPGTPDLENPVPTNLAVMLPDDSSKWLIALCKSMDIFSIWILVLLAIGFAAVNPKKLKFAQSLTIVVAVWAAFVLLQVAVAFVFS